MCRLAGLCIVRCTCSLPERLEVLGAGSVRIERLNMSYLHTSRALKIMDIGNADLLVMEEQQ